MFTGIIHHVGTVREVNFSKGIIELAIEAPKAFLPGKKIGDSVAIDGACLTIVKLQKTDKKGILRFDVIPETLSKTIIEKYQKGTVVNLENPLRAGDRLDGHFVQGHIDFIAKVQKITEVGKSKTMRFNCPPEMKKFFAVKGSITVNGVSLTLSKMGGNFFEVSLIPQTLKTTNLGQLNTGNHVNIEIDLLSRYLEALTNKP